MPPKAPVIMPLIAAITLRGDTSIEDIDS